MKTQCSASNVEFSSAVMQAVSNIRNGEEAIQEALNRILNTYYLASTKRKAPKKITHFSTNIGEKGKVKLIKARALTRFEIQRNTVAIDLLESESGRNENRSA